MVCGLADPCLLDFGGGEAVLVDGFLEDGFEEVGVGLAEVGVGFGVPLADPGEEVFEAGEEGEEAFFGPALALHFVVVGGECVGGLLVVQAGP